MNYHLTWIMSVCSYSLQRAYDYTFQWICESFQDRFDVISSHGRSLFNRASTVGTLLSFQPWFLAVTGFLSERKQRKHQENYKSWELDLVVGLENYMLHTVQQNIEHSIWRDDAWIHSRSNHSRSSSLVHQTGNHATFWVWYWQFPLYMLDPPHHPGSQSPPGLLIFLIGNPYKPFVWKLLGGGFDPMCFSQWGTSLGPGEKTLFFGPVVGQLVIQETIFGKEMEIARVAWLVFRNVQYRVKCQWRWNHWENQWWNQDGIMRSSDLKVNEVTKRQEAGGKTCKTELQRVFSSTQPNSGKVPKFGNNYTTTHLKLWSSHRKVTSWMC